MNFQDDYNIDTSGAVKNLKRLESAQDDLGETAGKSASKSSRLAEAMAKAAEGSQPLAEGLNDAQESMETALSGFGEFASVIGGPLFGPVIVAAGLAILNLSKHFNTLSRGLSGESTKSVVEYQGAVEKLNAELVKIQEALTKYIEKQQLNAKQGEEYLKLREKEKKITEEITKATEAEAAAKAEIDRLEGLKKAQGKSADEKKALVERQITEQGGAEIGDIEKQIADRAAADAAKKAKERTAAIKKNLDATPEAKVAYGDFGREYRVGPEGSLSQDEKKKALEKAQKEEQEWIEKSRKEAEDRAKQLLIGATKGDSSSIEQLKGLGFKDSKTLRGIETTLATGKTDADREAEEKAAAKAKAEREDAARIERAKKDAAPIISDFIDDRLKSVSDPLKKRREARERAEAEKKKRIEEAAEENEDLVELTVEAKARGLSDKKIQDNQRSRLKRKRGELDKDIDPDVLGDINKKALEQFKAASEENKKAGLSQAESMAKIISDLALEQRRQAQQLQAQAQRLNQARQSLRPSGPSVVPSYN